MDKRLRAWLEQNGLCSDATEKEAWDRYAQLRADNIVLEGFEDAQRAEPGDGGTGSGVAPNADDEPDTGRAAVDDDAGLQPDIQAQIDAAVQRARVKDANVRRQIDERLAVAGFDGPDHAGFRSEIMADPTMTAERATEMIFKPLQEQGPAIGAGAAVSVGMEDREKVRDAATDALMLRSGLPVTDQSPGASEFRGRSLIEIGCELLERAGTSTRGMSKRQKAGLILSNRAAGGAMSTSDFPLILSSLVNKTLLKAYMEWPQTWKPIDASTDAQDSKDIHALR